MRLQNWRLIPFLAVFLLLFTAIETRAAAPTITSLSPTSGAVGASVVITGTNFGLTQGSSTVKFNGTTATPCGTCWNSTTITVNVPTGAGTGNVVVTVSGVASNGKSFTVLPTPSITSLSLTSGAVGASVVITGTNLGSTQGASTVKFNGTTATPCGTCWNATTITVNVPTGATTGNVVVHASGTDTNGKSFTVLATPSITSLSTASGPVGTPVTITGTNFGSTQGSSTVKFNGTIGTPCGTCWNATTITVNVPTGATTGNVVVHASGVDTNGKSFTVSGFTSTGGLSTGRYGQTATLLNNGTVLIVGGYDVNGNQLASAELYNPATGAFTATGSLNTARGNFTATLLDGGAVLIAGGMDSNANLLGSAELYNPATGSFTFTGSLANARASHTATLLSNGRVLLAGSGDSAGNVLASAELYDPSSGTFIPTGSLNTARALPTATLLNNGNVLVLGGAGTGGVLASAELYSPATGTFTVTGSLNTARATHTATLLNNGMVLVAGGEDVNGNTFASAELYNPATQTFALTGNMNVARGADSATLLTNGLVLVEGGFGNMPVDMMASAELYDPVAGTFVQTGSLNVARQSDTATLLASGLVLVAGGFNDSANNLRGLSDSELYQPATLVPANLISIALSPLNPSIPVGTAMSFAATGTFSGNSTQSLASAVWSSSNSAIATVSNDSSNRGVAFAAAIGSTTVSACTGSICGSTTLTVVAAAPDISVLSPISGSVGSALTIIGTGFGAIQSGNKVLLNQTAALVTSWSPTSIAVSVPNETTGNIAVQVGGVSSNLFEFTVLSTPAIGSVSPTTGDIGATVQISGANFGDTPGTSTITVNGTALSVATWSATSITGTISTGSTTGNVIVTVGSVASNPVSFTVTNVPSIFSLSPALGPAATLVTITGADFGATTGIVTFNGLTATINSWNPNSIVASVPAGATSGPVVVNVAGTLSNGVNFVTAGPPNISSLYPAAGLVGQSVTITGTNFGTVQGTVAFDGTAAAITSWSSTQIVAAVPSGAQSGNVTVTASGVTGTAIYFVVLPAPVISSLSPNAGPITPITVNGSGFGANQGTSTVTFNGLAAPTPTTWSATSIVVPLPNNVTSGPVVVTVLSVPSNNVTYKGSPRIASLSVTSGVIGDPLTITGVNMDSGSQVAFTDYTGQQSCWTTPTTTTSTTMVTTVPACAATGSVGVEYQGSNFSTYYSNGINFTVNPSITSLSPTSGTVGTSVQVNGGPFGFPQGSSTITFDGMTATPTLWLPSQINFYPPVGSASGNVVVTVNNVASNPKSFMLNPGPVISGISKASGPAGASVIITGTGFGTSQGSSTVTFNGVIAAAAPWSSTSITVTVPGTASTGNIVVTNGVASNGVNFTVIPPPTISFYSQTTGSAGLSLIIYGSNFGSAQGSSTVTFNGTNAPSPVWSDSQITVPVPFGASTGNVVVTIPGLPPGNGPSFTVVPRPTISSLSTTTGPAGTPVTINGTSFDSTKATDSVTFNGVPATVLTATTTKITTTVPEGATTGNIVVVTSIGLTTGTGFTVSPGSTITSVSPTKGGIGATVTITGVAFGQTQGTSSVKFNGLIAPQAIWSDSSIIVPVPSGATTGNVVVVVNNAASNGINFTVTPGFSISAVTPNSGNTGETVTVTGTGFGTPQGSNTVKFNGTTATVTSWTSTSITTTVPAATTSGPVVITIGGAVSDGIYFTATPEILGITPEPAALGAALTITGSNFGAAQGTSVVTCNGAPSGVSTWNSSTIVVSLGTCPTVLGSNPVQITVNGVPSLLATIQGIPVATFSMAVPMTAPLGAPVLLIGKNFGLTQGQSTVTINGKQATPTRWTDTYISAPVPAGAASTGQIDVVVGGLLARYSQSGFTAGTLPTPNSLQITPAAANMLIGDTRQFTAVDEFGRPRLEATWTVDNGSLATISTGGSPTLTAVAAGAVTLTATAQGVSSHIQVTISSATSFALGTVLWSMPSVPGFSPSQILQAVPTGWGPDLYSIQKSSDGKQTMILALTLDGQELWQTTLGPLTGDIVADAVGGMVLTQACDPANPSGSPMTVKEINAVSGSWWSFSITNPNACPPGPPKTAIRQDGAAIIALPLQISQPLLVLDGLSGNILSLPPIPPSTFTDPTGASQSCDCLTPVGQPIVDSDGSTYVEYEVRESASFHSSPPTVSSSLSLLKIAPDNSTSTTQLSSSTSANLFPGTIIPDGQGGVLATWTIVNLNPPAATQPYQAAYVSSGAIVSSYALPMAPTEVTNGPDALPINYPMVLGENGTAFVSYPGSGSSSSTTVAYSLSSGSAIWTYQPSVQGSTSIPAAALFDNSLIIQDSQLGLVPLSPTGTAGAAIPGIQLGSPWSLGQWLGMTSGGTHGAMAGPLALLARPWPTLHGGLDPMNEAAQVYIADIIPFEGVGNIGFNTAAAAETFLAEREKQANHVPLLATNATVGAFLSTIENPHVTAIAYMGHSFVTLACIDGGAPPCGAEYSIGLQLSDGTPGGKNGFIASPAMGTSQYPVAPACVQGKSFPICHPNAVSATSAIQTQARVIFIGACDIGPVFENLWNISSNTTGQALIVPTTSDELVVIGHGIAEWDAIINLMMNKHQTVFQAVKAANQLLLQQKVDTQGNPITEQWTVVPPGAGNVTLY
jgi:hypothetical protein